MHAPEVKEDTNLPSPTYYIPLLPLPAKGAGIPRVAITESPADRKSVLSSNGLGCWRSRRGKEKSVGQLLPSPARGCKGIWVRSRGIVGTGNSVPGRRIASFAWRQGDGHLMLGHRRRDADGDGDVVFFRELALTDWG
jgi:hypothetical protein